MHEKEVVVEVYSKSDCHLCDEALEVIHRVRKDVQFDLRVIKLHEGDSEFETYKERFPVIHIDGEFAFQYRVPEKLLRQKLAAGTRA